MQGYKTYTSSHELHSQISVIATFVPKLLLNLNTRSRLLIALSLSTLVGIILPQSMHLIARVIATWDVGAISFLAFIVNHGLC